MYLSVYIYIYIYQLQSTKSIEHPPCLFPFQVLAAVILVTFFFASAMNPGIIPRNESIPQEPPMGTAFSRRFHGKKNEENHKIEWQLSLMNEEWHP